MEVPAFATEHERCAYARLLCVSAKLATVLVELEVQQCALEDANAVVQQLHQPTAACPQPDRALVSAAVAAAASVHCSRTRGDKARQNAETSLVCTDHALQTLLDAAASGPDSVAAVDASGAQSRVCAWAARAARPRLAICAAACARAANAVHTGRVCAQRMAAVAERVKQAAAAGACWDPDVDLAQMEAWQNALGATWKPDVDLAQVEAPRAATTLSFMAVHHHPKAHAMLHVVWDWPLTVRVVLAEPVASPLDLTVLLDAWPCDGHHWSYNLDAARRDKLGDTVLMRACRDGDLASVRALLAHAPSRLGVNVCRRGGITALMLASAHGHVVVVKELLQWRRGDDGSGDGSSCHHDVRATRRGHCRRRRGPGHGHGCGGTAVNPTLCSKRGCDALRFAITAGHVPVMHALLAHPAVQGTLNVLQPMFDPYRLMHSEHHTAFSWACFLAEEFAIEALLAFSAQHPHLLDVFTQLPASLFRTSCHALHVAAQTCSSRVLKMLLERVPPTRAQCKGLARALVDRKDFCAGALDVILALPPDRLDTEEVSAEFISACSLPTASVALHFLGCCAHRLDLRVRDFEGCTALDRVVQQRCGLQLFAALLTLEPHRFDVDANTTTTILFNCATKRAWQDDMDVVARAIDAGRMGNVATVTADGSTIAELLLQKLCAENAMCTPWCPGFLLLLKHSTFASALFMIRVLLRLRAPLDVVAVCVQRFADAGVNWDALEFKAACKRQPCRCKTPLVCIAAASRPDVLKVVLELRPQDGLVQDADGNTALHHAVRALCASNVRPLLMLPAECLNVHARNRDGLTAMECAVKAQRPLLREKLAELAARQRATEAVPVPTLVAAAAP